MRFFYTFSIYLYACAIRIASLFNPKAKLWLNGRKNIIEDIRFQIQSSRLKTNDSKLIWFHCASLGEFEQGRPLMEKYKSHHPEAKIVITFFSPSGYEIRKNYAGADYIFYLPIDTVKNAKTIIEIIQPTAVFFVKYEFWFNYLFILKNKNIPTYLVSGIFRKEQLFFKWYGAWFRKQLASFTTFFVQNETSVQLLNSIGYNNVLLTGDTRFDRVFEIATSVKEIDLVKKFVDDNNVLIVGSSWSEDEKIIANFFENNQLLTIHHKLIIAPHEIGEIRIQSIEYQFNKLKTARYSEADERTIQDAQVLIIDNIGMLSSLYQYGTIAYIGGGFGKGIHNILEAATVGLPVILGPRYEKFIEAKELIELGGAFSINNVVELEKIMLFLNDAKVLKTISQTSKTYVQNRTGATEKILNVISARCINMRY